MKKIIPLLAVIFFITACGNTDNAKAFYLDAVKEYKNQNFEKALILTEKAIYQKRNFYQAEFLKAKILFFTKDYQGAEIIFKRLTKKKYENYDFKLWLLRCLIFNGKFEEADIYLTKLIQANTEDWRLYYYKAQIAKHENNFEKYFSNLNTADSFLKDSSTVYLDLGLIWHEFGMSEKSSLYYSKAQILCK